MQGSINEKFNEFEKEIEEKDRTIEELENNIQIAERLRNQQVEADKIQSEAEQLLNDNKLSEVLQQQEVGVKAKVLSDQRIAELEQQLQDLSGTSVISDTDDEFIITDRITYPYDVVDPTTEPLAEPIKRVEDWIPKITTHTHEHKDSSPKLHRTEDGLHAHAHTHSVAPYEDLGRHLRLEPHGHSPRSKEHLKFWKDTGTFLSDDSTTNEVIGETTYTGTFLSDDSTINEFIDEATLEEIENNLDQHNKHTHKHKHRNKTGKGSRGHNHKHKHRDSHIGHHTARNSHEFPHDHKKPDSRHEH